MIAHINYNELLALVHVRIDLDFGAFGTKFHRIVEQVLQHTAD